jgi:hypothetical protein
MPIIGEAARPGNENRHESTSDLTNIHCPPSAPRRNHRQR